MAGERSCTQRGQAIVLVAFMMVVLLGFVGLAVDGGRAYLDRREQQAAVDASALAAANSCMNNSNCLKNASFSQAEQAAISMYGLNLRLYSAPTCSGLGSLLVSCSFADPTNQRLTINVTNRSVAGILFTASGNHRIPVAIMQVLGSGTSIPIAATATAVAREFDKGSAIQTLSPAGCGGNNGHSLTFTGSSTAILDGDVWSNGDITDSNNAAGTVSGNVIDICPPIPPSPMPNFTVSGVQTNGTPRADPGYARPALNPTPQTWPSSDHNVDRQPGTYNLDPKLTNAANNGCFFLAAGAYTWGGGFSDNGGFVSNELRAPDEPNVVVATNQPNLTTTTGARSGTITSIPVNPLAGDVIAGWPVALGGQTFQASATALAGATAISVVSQAVTGTIPVGSWLAVRTPAQFWDSNSVGCAGEFMPYTVGSLPGDAIPAATYAVEVTSVRWEPSGCGPPASPTCLLRESPPSMCKTATLGSSQVLKIWVSNVPGARAYNVYLAPSGACDRGPFGYAAQFTNTVTEQNGTVSGCDPSLVGLTSPPNLNNCDLGSTSGTITASALGAGWAPIPSAAQDTGGAPPPDNEEPSIGPTSSGVAPVLPNANPPTGNPPRGDLANENYCLNAAGNGGICPGSTTPGAVFFYIPGGGSTSVCLNLQGGGSDYLFTGYQYARILLYEPGALQAPPANTCPNNVTGGALTSLLGIFYLPGAGMTIAGNSSYFATIAGGLISWTATIKGSGGVSITADHSLEFPGAVQLVQ